MRPEQIHATTDSFADQSREDGLYVPCRYSLCESRAEIRERPLDVAQERVLHRLGAHATPSSQVGDVCIHHVLERSRASGAFLHYPSVRLRVLLSPQLTFGVTGGALEANQLLEVFARLCQGHSP